MKQIDLTKVTELVVDEDSSFFASYLGEGDSDLITNLKIVHRRPGIRSQTDIRIVLRDRAKFSNSTLLHIAKGAVGTNAHLNIGVLILSENADANIVPGLEVLENDVKAGHAASISYIDQEQLFYLQSRGYSLKTAEDLIVKGFLSGKTNIL